MVFGPHNVGGSFGELFVELNDSPRVDDDVAVRAEELNILRQVYIFLQPWHKVK